jgi:hypothetical protein
MRIDQESGAVSSSRKHLVFAYYITGHGFGHATRVTEVKKIKNSSQFIPIFGFSLFLAK